MFKTIAPIVWAFDCEWIPDADGIRKVLNLPPELGEAECFKTLWERNGATSENPEPYIKPLLCRVVSLAAVQRIHTLKGTKLGLMWLPKENSPDASDAEQDVLVKFLDAVGQYKPQLVGYNSRHADLPVLWQRAFVHGLCLPEFSRRPEKPWEGVDYFSRSESHIDLMDVLTFGERGAASPSLIELARLAGFPEKAYTGSVASLWLERDMTEIIERCIVGALTTYLAWLRMAHLGGFFTPQQYRQETDLFTGMLEELAGQGYGFAKNYLARWELKF